MISRRRLYPFSSPRFLTNDPQLRLPQEAARARGRIRFERFIVRSVVLAMATKREIMDRAAKMTPRVELYPGYIAYIGRADHALMRLAVHTCTSKIIYRSQ